MPRTTYSSRQSHSGLADARERMRAAAFNRAVNDPDPVRRANSAAIMGVELPEQTAQREQAKEAQRQAVEQEKRTLAAVREQQKEQARQQKDAETQRKAQEKAAFNSEKDKREKAFRADRRPNYVDSSGMIQPVDDDETWAKKKAERDAKEAKKQADSQYSAKIKERDNSVKIAEKIETMEADQAKADATARFQTAKTDEEKKAAQAEYNAADARIKATKTRQDAKELEDLRAKAGAARPVSTIGGLRQQEEQRAAEPQIPTNDPYYAGPDRAPVNPVEDLTRRAQDFQTRQQAHQQQITTARQPLDTVLNTIRARGVEPLRTREDGLQEFDPSLTEEEKSQIRQAHAHAKQAEEKIADQTAQIEQEGTALQKEVSDFEAKRKADEDAKNERLSQRVGMKPFVDRMKVLDADFQKIVQGLPDEASKQAALEKYQQQRQALLAEGQANHEQIMREFFDVEKLYQDEVAKIQQDDSTGKEDSLSSLEINDKLDVDALAEKYGMSREQAQGMRQDAANLSRPWQDLINKQEKSRLLSDGRVLVNPRFWVDEKAYTDAVNSSGATEEGKKESLAMLPALKREAASNLLNSLAKSESLAELVNSLKGKTDEEKVDELLKMRRDNAFLKAVGARLNASAESMAGGVMGLISAATGNDWAAESMQRWNERSSAHEALAGTSGLGPVADFLSKIPAGAQSIVPALAGGAGAQALGRLAGLSEAGVTAAGLAGSAATAGFQSAGGTFGQAFDAALAQNGQDFDKARIDALKPSIISGLITAAATYAGGAKGVESVFREPAGKAMVKQALWRAIAGSGIRGIKEGLEETLEEGVDTLAQGILERLTFNPNKGLSDIINETLEAGALGFALGGGVSTGNDAVSSLSPESKAIADAGNLSVSDSELAAYAPEITGDPATDALAEIAPDRARVLRKIAQGTQLKDLENGELTAIGLDRSPELEIAESKRKDRLPPAVSVENGQPIILQEALDELEQQFPATRALIGMSEREARARISQPTDDESGTESGKPVVASGGASAATPSTVQAGTGEPSTPISSPPELQTSGQNPSQATVTNDAPPTGQPANVSAASQPSGGAATQPEASTANPPPLPQAVSGNPQVSPVVSSAPVTPSGSASQGQNKPVEKPAKPVTPKEHVLATAKAMIEKAKDKVAGYKVLTRARLVAEAVDRVAGNFAGVVFDPESKAPVSIDAKTGELIVNVERAVARMNEKSVKDATKWLDRALDEEFRHRVAVDLEQSSESFANDLKAWFDALSPELKEQSRAAYFAQAKNPDQQFASEFEARHEAFRQYWSNEKFAGLVEAALNNKGALASIRKLIAQFIKELRRLSKGANPQVKAIADRLIAQAEAKAAYLKGEGVRTDAPKKKSTTEKSLAVETALATAPSEDLDAEYFRAFLRGDEATMQKMVDDAAKAAGITEKQQAVERDGESVVRLSARFNPSAKDRLYTAPDDSAEDEEALRRLSEQAEEPQPTEEEERALAEFYAEVAEIEQRMGLPTTPVAPSPRQTSLKNSVVDKERVARGLQPIQGPIVRSWGEVGEAAARLLNANPQAGYDIIRQVKNNPRTLSDEESAVVLLHKAAVRHKLHKLSETMNSTPRDSEANKKAKEDYDHELEELHSIDMFSRAVGTEAGRSLAIRKLMQDEDSSPESLMQKYRTEVNLGEPLTDEQKAIVTKHAEAIQKKERELSDIATEPEIKAATEALHRLIDDLKKEVAELKGKLESGKPSEGTKAAPTRRSPVAKFIHDRAKAAREKVAGLFGKKLNTAPDEGKSKPLPRSENIKIGANAAAAFKARIPMAADSIGEIRSGYDGVGRLMEAAMLHGGTNEAIAFREWLLRQKELPDGAREALLKFEVESQTLETAPEDLTAENLADLAEVGAEYIEDGATDLEQFTKALVADLGEDAAPFAERIYNEAKKLHAQAQADLEASRKPESVLKRAKTRLGELPKGDLDKRLLTDLARAYIRQGVSETEDIVTRITKDIQAIYPDATEANVRTVLSGYGKTTEPTKDEVERKLSEVKGQARELQKLDDIAHGIGPRLSGYLRGPKNQKQRDLEKRVRDNLEAARRAGIITDGPGQLASRRKAVVMRLNNQIEDLNAIISGKSKPRAEKDVVKYDEEMNALVKERDALKAYVDDLTGPSPELKWNRRAQAAAKASEEHYRRRIAKNDLENKKPSPQPESAETKRLRAEAQAAKDEWEALREASGIPQRELLDRARTKLRERIAEYDRQIQEGFEPPKGKKPLSNPELQALRETRNHLRKALLNTEGGKKWTDEKRAQAATASVEKSIADLKRRIAEKDTSAKAKTAPVEDSPELKALKEEQAFLREVYASVKEAQNPRRLPEEIALDNFRRSLDKKRRELEAKLTNKEYLELPAPDPLFQARRDKAAFELRKAREEWTTELFNRKLEARTGWQKTIGTAAEVVNTARAVLTSLDFSAVLRQGGFIALGNPIRAIKSLPAMFKAFASEQSQFSTMEEIKRRPNFPLYEQAGLYLSDMNELDLSKMEEAFMSRWANKIPLVAGSQRAYTTFLNKLRADSFDAMVASLGRDGRVTMDEGKALASYINVATGRGTIPLVGENKQANPVLSTIFFAPRLVASRLNLILGQPMYGGSARTRKLVAKEYAKFLAGFGVAIALAALAKDDEDDAPFMVLDPRSSDFGKVRFKNTRIDFLAGLQQVTTFLTRSVTGESINAKGELQAQRDAFRPLEWLRENRDSLPQWLQAQISPSPLGPHKFGTTSSGDMLGRFMRSKFSPVFGTIADIYTGKDFMGKPVTVGGEIFRMVVPMTFQSIGEVMKDQGVPRGTTLTLLSLLGVGLQTYDTAPPANQASAPAKPAMPKLPRPIEPPKPKTVGMQERPKSLDEVRRRMRAVA